MKEIIKLLQQCYRLNKPFLVKPEDAVIILEALGYRPYYFIKNIQKL